MSPSPRSDSESTAGNVHEREALHDAAARLERVRQAARDSSPEAILPGWSAMVRAGWSVVDHFERDGKRYVVAIQDDACNGGTPALTTREREIASLAALGRSNKVIAYDLGIAPSTVRVLLARALAKLGLGSRAALEGRALPWEEAHQTDEPR